MMMNESRGYSSRFIRQVYAADPELIGVRLAKVCIEHEIPVQDIAEKTGVSRQTVYSWFVGRFKPRADLTELLEDLWNSYASGKRFR